MLGRLSGRILPVYYAATIVFLLLDFAYGINIRLAFLDESQSWRLAYYVLCALLFGMMLWRPEWADLLGAVESLVTLTALILGMALRVMVVSDEMIESGRGFVTPSEIINFVMSGGIAWLAWQGSMLRLQKKFPNAGVD